MGFSFGTRFLGTFGAVMSFSITASMIFLISSSNVIYTYTYTCAYTHILLAGVTCKKSIYTLIVPGPLSSKLEERCTFCQRTVIDDNGQRTEDFGIKRNGKFICTRCVRAFEFSLGS